MSFRLLPDRELRRLSDDQLISYFRNARDAGEVASSRHALAVLVYGHEGNVKRRLSLLLPSHEIDDVTHDALVKAIAATFNGNSRGEFRSWLHTIVDRAAADWLRRKARRPAEGPLPSGDGDEDAGWKREPAAPSHSGEVELRLIIDEVMAELSELHRRVIDLHLFGALTAKEVCERIDGMSEDNVAQIASRFRAKLRKRLHHPTGAQR